MSAASDGAERGLRARRSAAGCRLRRDAGLAAVAVAGIVCATLTPGIAASAASASSPTVSWGRAEEVPGLGTLNAGGNASVVSLSCRRLGYCSAAGTYTDTSSHGQPFVVNESKGQWGKARELPGIAALSSGKGAGIGQLSCAAPGYCSVGGGYADASGHGQVYVANESKGRWGTAEEVPGTAALNAGGSAGINQLSCPSRGNCTAGGTYTDADGNPQPFVVNESKGRWGTAGEVPGMAALKAVGGGRLVALSCGSAGNCAGGGYYLIAPNLPGDGEDEWEAFVVTEVSGRWGKAEEVPGSNSLNANGQAEISALSCPSAGNCGAVGFYAPDRTAGGLTAFVVNESKGRWGKAQPARGLPGTKDLNPQGYLNTLSCPSPGNCAAGGYYSDGLDNNYHAFVVTEKDGTWGTGEQVPGTAAYAVNFVNMVNSVSCSSAGNCGAWGPAGNNQAFVVAERNGSWARAEVTPGITALNRGEDASVNSVSCPRASNCVAAGSYTDQNGKTQAFVGTG
jgi:hypothetical protein